MAHTESGERIRNSGPVYMVLGTRDNPPPRDNFTERLYGVVGCNSRDEFAFSCKQLVEIFKEISEKLARPG